MIAISLQSGSNGNCIYVEAEGTRLLFDAGISGIQAERRLLQHGRNIRDVDALVISHSHSDHVRSAGVFNRKYGIPIYMTRTTYETSAGMIHAGSGQEVCHFNSGEAIDFGAVSVMTIPTPHDAEDSVSFVVQFEGRRLGILTDLGHVFDDLAGIIASLNAVFLESNYDPAMLESGPYPQFLKNRIAGSGGHISNFQCWQLLAEHGSNLQWACLSHLSAQNNDPETALGTCREITGDAIPLQVASRYEVGAEMRL